MMKKSMKLAFGATLLEIMLVLAIAAMVIVMSIRFYKSASSSQNANSILSQIQAITAAADSLAQGSNGSYTAVTQAGILNIIGAKNNVTAYGNIAIANGAATTYTVTLPAIPADVCTLLSQQLKSNTRYTNVTTCAASPATTALKYTYDSTK
ncbi:MAG: hypothetical protein SFW66_09315 [Gammaproteobacteria bacterium]|nr:hypothetical protein [Gammaproteobacteria bacterium]